MTAGWETRDGRADMTNFEMDLFDTRMTNPMDKEADDDEDCCKNSIIKPACLPITILAFLLFMTFFLPLFNEDNESSRRYEKTGVCTDKCMLEIVESIPTGLVYPAGYANHTSTFQAWTNLLDDAKSSIDIAAFYWNMRNASKYETAWQGNETFNKIVEAGRRGVSIRIAQNMDAANSTTDANYLADKGLAEVRSVNFTRIFGSGVLHTKIWIVDQQHVYIGSANMDWKSLTEVKELGVVIRNCSCIAHDLSKIFTVYWRLGERYEKFPIRWPINLRSNFNFNHPLQITFNTRKALTFISSAPPDFNSKGREYDLHAIVKIMKSAKKNIRIAVMDYVPTTVYMPKGDNHYFAAIDDVIRESAFRGVKVQLLISRWSHNLHGMFDYLKSLLQMSEALKLGAIYVKIFDVPSTPEQQRLSFARVNHNKYMLTDDTVYIGTSNWVGDYFLTTAGVGFIFKAQANVRSQNSSQTIVDEFTAVFDRDWNSPYATFLNITEVNRIQQTFV